MSSLHAHSLDFVTDLEAIGLAAAVGALAILLLAARRA